MSSPTCSVVNWAQAFRPSSSNLTMTAGPGARPGEASTTRKVRGSASADVTHRTRIARANICPATRQKTLEHSSTPAWRLVHVSILPSVQSRQDYGAPRSPSRAQTLVTTPSSADRDR
jgi:hypothetical protein